MSSVSVFLLAHAWCSFLTEYLGPIVSAYHPIAVTPTEGGLILHLYGGMYALPGHFFTPSLMSEILTFCHCVPRCLGR